MLINNMSICLNDRRGSPSGIRLIIMIITKTLQFIQSTSENDEYCLSYEMSIK